MNPQPFTVLHRLSVSPQTPPSTKTTTTYQHTLTVGWDPNSGARKLVRTMGSTSNPMEYLWLELRDTFLFEAIHPPGTREHRRASVTISWLGLNERDDLVAARKVAYGDFRARVKEYASYKRKGADEALNAC